MAEVVNMKMVDCHCHLSAEEFEKDIQEVVDQSKRDGVGAVLAVSIVPGDFEKIIKLSEQYPDFVLPCLGVHPVQEEDNEQRCVTEKDFDDALPLFDRYHQLLVGIGEVGLDFQPRICPTPEDKAVQRQILIKQIEIAKKYDLPVNVHSRSAGRPTIELLKEHGVKKALLHAFDGRPAVARQGVEAGYFFSIPPCIARSEQKQNLVKTIPLENMMLETDSPALGPVKQERNVPSNLQISCEFIAKLKNVTEAEVRRITTENAIKLFPKLSKLFVK